MHVIKRNGEREPMRYDKITQRMERLMKDLDPTIVDPAAVTQKVVQQLPSEIRTSDIDTLAAETCGSMNRDDPQYSILGARIIVSNMQKQAPKTFSRAMEIMHQNTWNTVPVEDFDDGEGVMHFQFMDLVRKHAADIDKVIDPSRDFLLDDFAAAMKLSGSYCRKVEGRVVETPQFFFMRVALGVIDPYAQPQAEQFSLAAAFKAYHRMSQLFYTHASPTLYNAGKKQGQLSSCYLVQMTEDSIEGIFDTLKKCAAISKYAGGIGLDISKIRCKGSNIKSSNRPSSGIIPMLRTFNAMARYVDQGGLRPGAVAVYLPPWHADIFEFLQLRKNNGDEESRCRDLFLGLWISDLFMKRVKDNAKWSLMDPAMCPGLNETFGDEFEALYLRYENEGKIVKTVEARTLWFAIMAAQQETSVPYMLYKDACNRKSNQSNLGTIRCSNLCTEIVQYTAPDEVAVCNLASMTLWKFVNVEKQKFDFQLFFQVCQEVVERLNTVIDINFYPVAEAEHSNMTHAPIGLGVQGLANVFFLLHLPFTSPEARALNREIFAVMYYAALTASNQLSKQMGPYDSFKEPEACPASKGILQFDMWGVEPLASTRCGFQMNWPALKASIKKHGLANSLLIAPMPTASTSTILGSVECIEPISYNVYMRATNDGNFVMVNKHLYRDMRERNLWSKSFMEDLMRHKGSVQNIECVPDDLKEIYKTVWEISVRDLIDMAADRGPYIDQSQSFNVHMEHPSQKKLSSMHFYGWERGLKTGMYYLRREPEADAIQFTIEPEKTSSSQTNVKQLVCRKEDGCVSCQ